MVLIVFLVVAVVIGYLIYDYFRKKAERLRAEAEAAAAAASRTISVAPELVSAQQPPTQPPASPRPPAPIRTSAPGWVCALDLGTHAAKAAIWTPGEAPRVVSFGARPTLPAPVGIDEYGRWLVGEEALAYALNHPLAVLRNPKGEIDRAEVILQGPDGRVWRRPPAAFLAATLAELYRAAAAAHSWGPLRQIVLTHPATWVGMCALDVLVAALRQVGAPDVPVRLVAEPVAAAAWCEYHHPDVTGSGAPFIVADVGGGSLDIAVLLSGNGGTQVLAPPVGRDDVGGNAIDAALLEGAGSLWARSRPGEWERLQHGQGPSWAAARQQCADNARSTKEILTEFDHTSLRLAFPAGCYVDVGVTRPQFDGWIEDLLWKTVGTIDTVANTCGLPRGTPIFLCGGSTRVRALREILHGRGFAVVDPDASGAAELVVVCGAAVSSHVAC